MPTPPYNEPSEKLYQKGSRSFSNDNWDFTLWGKNIFDEEYVANTFVLPSFSNYIVALGARDTWGVTARYNF